MTTPLSTKRITHSINCTEIFNDKCWWRFQVGYQFHRIFLVKPGILKEIVESIIQTCKNLEKEKNKWEKFRIPT